jgi:hypothetical protein
MKDGTIQHETGLLIWEGTTPDNKSLWLQMFYPKAKKPFCNYAFKTLERLQTYKENQIKAYKELLEIKRARKEAAKATPEKLALIKVGDIFNWTWGYEQTNQDYFQLIELRGQIGIFRELDQDRTETGWLTGNCKPIKDSFKGDPFRKKIQFQNNKPYIKMASFGWCNLWDGQTDYYTSYN